ELWAVGSLM
nr:phyllolitorin [Phyllomedusa sauvagii]